MDAVECRMFFTGQSGRLSLIFCELLVGGLHLLAPNWIWASLQHYCLSLSYLSSDLAAHSGGQKVFLSVGCTVTNRNKRMNCLQWTWDKIQWWASNTCVAYTHK